MSSPRVASIMLAAVVAWGPLAAGPANLLSNGGFEDGLIGWSPGSGHAVVTDRQAAHSGTSCLTAEVTQPKQAHILRRKVQVRAGNLYQFEIWARATNRTKLVLWVDEAGGKGRRQIAAWQDVPARWRRFAASLEPSRSGVLELQIVAPSSHAAPAGRMWIDDVALYETTMPPVATVSDDTGFDDEPSMARAPDGTLYVAWTSYRDDSDTLQLARYRWKDSSLERVGAWQVLGGAGTYVLGCRVVPAGRGVVLVYAAEVDRRWDVFAVPCDADGPDRPIALTSDPAVDVKPAGACRDETLWVAWESNRGGSREILAAQVKDGRPSEPTRLSEEGTSSYGPSIAILSSGEVCVAWHSFREDNYDIYLRWLPPGGRSWGAERRLTRAPSIDRHAVLLSRGDELWMCYENAQTEGYRVGATNRRRIIVAKVAPEGLLAPEDYAGTSPLYGRCEAPAAAFDPQGRIHIAYLRPQLPRSGWEVWRTGLAGNRWLPPEPVSSRKGMDRCPSIVVEGRRAVIAFQADELPRSWSDLDRTLEARSTIHLATVDLAGVPAAAPCELEPVREPDEAFEAGTIRQERGEDTSTPAITYRGETLRLFYGDLHEHTDVSVCNRIGDQTIDESYQHMRDIVRLDFACATDHGYNLNPYLWNYTAKLARTNEDRGRFLTFLAEEWTSTFEKYDTAHPYGYYGHRNLIFADPYFPRWWNARNAQTPAQVWEDLRAMKANFVHIPHQLADTGNVPTDWTFTDETAQPVAEIFQVRGSYEYKGAPREAKRTTPGPGHFLQDAWARGIVIGVIASPDHGGGMGKACVFAPDLSREAILDALRARHCFGTTAARIFLDVRVDGHLMGECIEDPAGESVEVTIDARCPGDIDRVEVCRNNRFIYANHPAGRTARLSFVDRDPLKGRSYYYVRVVQKDGEIAWTSPVWFGARGKDSRRKL